MSDITIPGVNSRFNTNKTVENLMEVERIPLKKYETRKENISLDKKIWEKINSNVVSLQKSSSSLYGLNNPFSERVVESSDSYILTATAERNAELENYDIKVLQTAKSDKFLSGELENNTQVDKGRYTFKIGDKKFSILFGGGSLEELSKAINGNGKGILKSSVVNITPEKKVILFESQITGSKNKIQFLDDSENLAKKLGMVKSINKSDFDINLEAIEAKSQYKIDNISDTEKVVNPKSNIKIPINAKLEDNSDYVLEIKYRLKNIKDLKEEPPTLPGFSNEIPSQIQREDIIVRYAPTESGVPPWEKPKPPKDIKDMNIFSITNSFGDKELKRSRETESEQTITIKTDKLDNQIDFINIDNKNSNYSVIVSDIKIYNPNANGNVQPINAIENANDAIIEYNGIKISRDTNNIDDVIPDITLNLHNASEKEVNILTKPDKEQIKNQIIQFVVDYNTVMQNTIVSTSNNPSVIEELTYLSEEEKETLKKDLGRMQGDMTLIQLKNRLQNFITNFYTTTQDSKINMLHQAGIGSHLSGYSGYDQSKNRGYLELDESKLEETIENRIDDLQNLFGYDSDGDLIADKGIGVEIAKYTKPYTDRGGIIFNKLQSYDFQTRQANKNIENLEDRLKYKEFEYKRKFGRMEEMVNSLEKNSKALDALNKK